MTPKSLSIFVAVAVSVLTQQAVGQASSATASTTTGSVSSATANPTENAWYIPLAGAGGDSSSPWGANVTTNGNPSPKLIPLVISNGTQTGVAGSSSSSAAVFPNAGSLAGGNNHQSLEVQLEDASNPELVLGLNAALGLSGSSQIVPTVPFGLNLGLAGKWNGSVLFGGNYDANRIYGQLAWQTVPEASNISSTFLATGHLPVASVSVRLFHYQSGQPPNAMGDAYPFGPSIADNNIQTVPAVLNISSESLILPAGDFCGNNFTLEFNQNSQTSQYPSFTIPVFAGLTSSSARCSANQNIGTSDSAPPMVLGLPFFQAAYIYVDANAEMYFSSINEWDLPIQSKPFTTTGLLANPSAPPSATTSTKPTASSNGGRIGVKGASVAFGCMWLAVFLLL